MYLQAATFPQGNWITPANPLLAGGSTVVARVPFGLIRQHISLIF